MGSVLTRPVGLTDIDKINLFIGMPFVEFAPKDAVTGLFGAFRQLGCIDSSALAKEIEIASFKCSQSGTSVLIKELVQSFEARLNVGMFNFDVNNMQLFFASADIVALTAGAVAITSPDEIVNLPADLGWSDLQKQIDTKQDVLPSVVTAEAVGTGDGLAGSGAVSGDFSLDFKVFAVADLATITVAGVPYTPVAVGAGASGNEVEVVIGTGATSGDLQFLTGTDVATDVTGDIVATYTPTFTLVENTHYVIDYLNSRIRHISIDEATTLLRTLQPVEVNYTHQQASGSVIRPFTQFVFEGRARVRQSSDVGINFDWTIPLVNVRLTDDDFEWSRDEFAIGNLSVTLVDDGTADPFGTFTHYDETAA